VPFPRAPATSEPSDRQSVRVQIERANPGSLGRPSRDAACAPRQGFTRFFALFFTGARGAPRGTGSLSGFWVADPVRADVKGEKILLAEKYDFVPETKKLFSL